MQVRVELGHHPFLPNYCPALDQIINDNQVPWKAIQLASASGGVPATSWTAHTVYSPGEFD